jgi:rhamnogalacturonyl hydrolase YesR
MKIASVIFVTLLSVLPATSSTAQKPKSWSIAMADTIMQRNPGPEQGPIAQWGYQKGYTLDGFEMLWRSTGDRRYIHFIQQEIAPYIDTKGNLVNVELNSLDNTMAGNIVVGLYESTHDPRYRTAATSIRRAFDTFPRNADGGFWHNRQFNGEMWIDGVFMGEMFLLRYGKSIGDREYCYDEATRQITLFAKHARKDDSGLYYHAWAEKPELATVYPERKVRWADTKTGLSSDVWSEGLGWYALVVVEALADLPKNHPRRAEVLDIYQRLAAGLKRTQDSTTGGWFFVVDKGNQPDNWIDNSGTAMFTYSLQRGIDLGLLDGKEYTPVVAEGYQAITAHAKVNDKGLVDIYNACEGLCVQASYSDYVHCPKVVNAKEAVAGFLWATTIVEKPKAASLETR